MRELYDAWIGASFDKQERFAAPRDWEWRCDLERGLVWLETPEGRKFTSPGQFLGRESECGARWTWGWAFPAGTVPEESLDDARRLRAFGREQEILALIVPAFDLNGRCGHQLALIASGIARAAHYVECETEEGSLYFLVRGDSAHWPDPNPVSRIMRIFPAILNRPEIEIADQRRAFRSYLEFYGLQVETVEQRDGTVISGREPGGRRLILGGFDKQGRALGLAEAKRSRRRRLPGGA